MKRPSLNNRGQSAILVSVVMSGALLSSAVVLDKMQSRNAKKSAAANTVSIHGHYMNELMAWHSYQMDVLGAPLTGPVGSEPGRHLAEIRPNTKVPMEGLPSDSVIPPDRYDGVGYVDGTPVNIKATSRLDAAQVIMQPKILSGLELWDETRGVFVKHCSSTAVSDTSATKSCLSQQVLPPVVDLNANGLDGPLTLPYGTAVTLDWTSSYADTCVFTPAIASTAATGIFRWVPCLPLALTPLRARVAGGSATDSVSK